MELSALALGILALTALVTGISKTGVPGMGLVFVVLLAMAMPAKLSTGYVLPFLIFGDILALAYWRRTVAWRYVVGVLPSIALGIVVGYMCMDRIEDGIYGRILGGIVFFLLVLDWVRRRYKIALPPESKMVAWFMGFLAGIMTMMANAAAPALILYLLSLNMSKEVFLGTTAWIYFALNLFKLPFSADLGLITLGSLKVNLLMLPFVVLGGYLGVRIIRNIPASRYENLMRVLILLGTLVLIFT